MGTQLLEGFTLAQLPHLTLKASLVETLESIEQSEPIDLEAKVLLSQCHAHAEKLF